MAVSKKQLLRVVDANFNRTKEGLRVCEDVMRYVIDDRSLTRKLKNIRHDVTAAVEALSILKMIEARSIETDVGCGSTKSEMKRSSIQSVFYANAQRVKESIRVLEEFTKLINPSVSEQLKQNRYKFYALEQEAVKKL